MKNIRRKLLALAGAATFLLSGCTYNGQTDKKTGKFYNTLIESCLEEATKKGELVSEKDEREYKGENTKILGSYDPSIDTYRYFVLTENKAPADYSTTKGFGNFTTDFVSDYLFDSCIPEDVIEASESSFTYDNTLYKGIENDVVVSIDSYSIEGAGYEGYRQTITTNLQRNDQVFTAAANYVHVTKDGKTLSEVTTNIVYTDDAVYSDGVELQGMITINNFDFPTVSQGYLSLENGQAYTQSELRYVQDTLNHVTEYNIQMNNEKTNNDNGITLK